MLIILLALFIAAPSFAQDFEREAAKREWQVLLHYKKTILGGSKSEIDHEAFFISPEGRTNPVAELEASLKTFQREDIPAGIDHPQCVFPARFNYIKKIFQLNVRPVECKDYQWWRENLPFHSATLIFASYYANNPASFFGHSFLRINSAAERSISDYGVDFSAISDTDGGVIFAIKGLFGGYTGLYSLKPYYMKLNVYIENENRDLWEYDLKLSREQMDRMISHLWELLRYGHFDYYFLTENCSYQILTLLEVANPEWNLSDEFTWNAIPIDTVKKVISVGAVSKTEYRPAFKKTVVQRLKQLDSDEKNTVRNLVNFKQAPETVTSAKVLEGAIASLRYERFEEKKFTREQENLLKGMLLQRAKVGGTVAYQDVKETLPLDKLRPDLSHDSEKYTFSLGNNTLQNTFIELGYKPSLHDQLDIDYGYPKNATIEMGDLKLRYITEEERFILNEFKYAEAFSLFPLDGHEFKWSWRAGLKTYRNYDGGCDDRVDCISTQLKSGGGLAKNLGFMDVDVYSMLLFNAELSNGFYKGYRVAPGLNLGGVWTITDPWKARYEFEMFKDLSAPDFHKEFRTVHSYGMSYNIKLQHEIRVVGRTWFTLADEKPVEEIQLNYGFFY